MFFVKNLRIDCDIRKKRLFLCSRDIQIGDNVQEIFSDGTLSEIYSFGKLPNVNNIAYLYNHNGIHHQTKINNVVKVIGKVSLKATWVKEGDIFTQEDVMKKVILECYYPDREIQFETERKIMGVEKTYIEKPNETILDMTILIKGCCGHFH